MYPSPNLPDLPTPGADDDVANDAAVSLWHGYRGRFTLDQLRQEAALP